MGAADDEEMDAEALADEARRACATQFARTSEDVVGRLDSLSLLLPAFLQVVAEMEAEDAAAGMAGIPEEDAMEGAGAEEDIIDEAETVLAGHKDPVYGVAFHPTNPEMAATAGGDDVGGVWNLATGERSHTLEGHTDTVNLVAWSGDGAYLATGSLDGTVRVWEECNPPCPLACLRACLSVMNPLPCHGEPVAVSLRRGTLGLSVCVCVCGVLCEVSKGMSQVNHLQGPGEDILWIEWHPKGPNRHPVQPDTYTHSPDRSALSPPHREYPPGGLPGLHSMDVVGPKREGDAVLCGASGAPT